MTAGTSPEPSSSAVGVSELEERLGAAESEVTSVRRSATRLEAQLAEEQQVGLALRAALDAERARRRDVEQRAAATAAEALDSVAPATATAASELSSALSAERSRSEELRVELARLQADLGEALAARATVEAIGEGVTHDLDATFDEVLELRERLGTADAEREQLRHALDESLEDGRLARELAQTAADELTALRAAHRELTAAADEMGATNLGLGAAVEQAEAGARSLEAQLEEARAESLRQLGDLRASLEARHAAAVDTLVRGHGETLEAQQREAAARLREATEAWGAERSAAAAEVDEERARSAADRAALEAAIDDERSTWAEERAGWTVERADLEAVAEDQRLRLQGEVDRLMADLQQLAEDATARAERDRLRIEELEAEVVKRSAEYEQLSGELEVRQSQVEVVRQRLREEIEGRAHAEHRRAELDDEVAFLRTDVLGGDASRRRRGGIFQRGKPSRRQEASSPPLPVGPPPGSQAPATSADVEAALERRLFGGD